MTLRVITTDISNNNITCCCSYLIAGHGHSVLGIDSVGVDVKNRCVSSRRRGRVSPVALVHSCGSATIVGGQRRPFTDDDRCRHVSHERAVAGGRLTGIGGSGGDEWVAGGHAGVHLVLVLLVEHRLPARRCLRL
uniref:Uncharacterized protein n=1 Tax=Romanomermis culicivorax TaxID=13658 RepID=A0A915K0S0_ROMCU